MQGYQVNYKKLKKEKESRKQLYDFFIIIIIEENSYMVRSKL